MCPPEKEASVRAPKIVSSLLAELKTKRAA
jgi:hypothetical protein